MRNMLHTKALVDKDSVGATQQGVIDQIIGSTPVLDRMGDIIDQGGWDLKDFKTNPVILWGHNMDEDKPPIGKALKVWIDGKGNSARLLFKVQFDLADKFAAEIYRKIKDGFINTVSVGFIPTEWEELDPGNFWGGLKYTSQQLLELSFVPVPANPEALVGLRSFAKTDKRFTPIEETKLFRPLVDKEVLSEIFNKPVAELESEEKEAEIEEKAENINVDPNSAPDEEGNVTGGTGGGGENDNTENKPDGGTGEMPSYDHTASFGEITVGDMRNEMTDAMESCMPGANKAQDGGKDNLVDGNSKDANQSSENKGDFDSMPPDNMMVKDMSVGHARNLFTDVFGDFQSNLNTTSNEGSNSEDVNNESFEGMTKEEKIAQKKELIELVEKAGRVLSGKNENKIKNAIDLLSEVILELEKEDLGEQDENNTAKSQEDKEEKAQVEDRGVIGYSDKGKSPESDSWDGPGEMAKASDPADWKAMCTWYDSAKADNKTSYKLPHHKGDAGHPSVWRGVAAAMAALMGSRGGVDIPEGDRKGVYNHLAKHYAEYEKTPPDFKMIEDQILKDLDEEILSLTLEREEKHVVRLVKKVLDNQKEQKKISVSEDQIVKALNLIDLALAKVA